MFFDGLLTLDASSGFRISGFQLSYTGSSFNSLATTEASFNSLPQWIE